MLLPAPLPRNLEASFRDLASEAPATRTSAIRDVVRHALLSDPTRSRAVPELERALRGDRVAAVRSAAAVALADLAAREALATLLVAVEDGDSHVRQMALSALGEIGDPRATRRLERALGDERPEVRYQAIIAFSRVARDDPDAVAEAIARALGDGDEAIRYIAMRIAEEFQFDGQPVRDPRIVARAEELADGPNDEAAVVAGLYLARLGQERGRALVLAVVAETRRTAELEDEQACVEVTGQLGIREAVPHLERRAWGTRRALRSLLSWGAGDRRSCAWHARISLARMGHARARAEILADLGSWRRETREAAVVAAGRAGIQEARGTLEHLGEAVDAALVREALARIAVQPYEPKERPDHGR
jgi:HEAT repeat protein